MAKYVIIKHICVIKNYEDVSHIWLFSGIQRKKAHKLHNKLKFLNLKTYHTFIYIIDKNNLKMKHNF